MTAAVVPAVKRCMDCGEVKSLDDFHKQSAMRDGKRPYCKPCAIARTRATAERRRARIGDEAERERARLVVARHRAKTGNASGKRRNRMIAKANAELIANHRVEFDAILARLKYEAESERAS